MPRTPRGASPAATCRVCHVAPVPAAYGVALKTPPPSPDAKLETLEYAAEADKVALDRRAMFTLFFVVLMGHIGFGMVIPLLPTFARRFEATELMVGALFSVYSVCQFVASPLLGMLSDRIGRRPVLIVSQLGSAAGYVLLAVALVGDWGSPLAGYMLVMLSRVVDGASAGNVSAAQAYITDVTGDDPAARSRALGLIGASFGLGFTLGPAIAALLAYFVSDSAGAWVAGGFALLSAILAAVLLKEPEKKVQAGGLSFSPGEVGRVLSDPVRGPLIGSWFLVMLAFVMVEPTLPMLLEDEFGYGQFGIGAFFFLIGVVVIVVQGGLIGRLTDRFGEWTLVLAGPVLVIAALVSYGLLSVVPAVLLLGAAGVLGATGRSVHTVASAGLIGRYAEGGRGGTTYGVYNAAASLARVLGPLVATGAYALGTALPFGVAAGVMTCGLLVLIWMRTTGRAVAAPVLNAT